MKLRCLPPRLAPARTTSGWKPDTVRGNRHERGYGRDWEKTRTKVLDRDNGLCQPCYSTGRVKPATEVDHIVPKSQGGSDAMVNLQSICRACHRVKTALESGGGESK